MHVISRRFFVGFVAAFTTFLLSSSIQLRPVFAQGECNEHDVRKNYSLYAEEYKNGNFESALPYLKWIIRCAPDFGTRTDRNFRRLVETYEGIALAKTESITRVAYLDSALTVFDTAPEAIKDAKIELDSFNWTFKKGYFLQAHQADLPERQYLVGDLYQAAYEINPTRLQLYYIDYIIQDKIKKENKEDALAFLNTVEADRGNEEEIQEKIERWREVLLTSPDERILFLQNQVSKYPKDVAKKNELLDLYVEEGHRREAFDLIRAMIDMQPSTRLYTMAATMRFEDGFEEEAIALYEKALGIEDDKERLSDLEFNLGIAYQQMGRFANAKTHLTRSLNTTERQFKRLIAMGDLVVASVQACGSFEREDKAVYWLATDYYERAVSSAGDQELKRIAMARIQRIKPYYPAEDEKFFAEWHEGEGLMIDYGCYKWIQEPTTIR